jgi:flagellar basal body P-ring formation protein FlgA
VTITLLPEVTIDDSLVTLEQIAKLTGGPDYLRRRLARLDVADFKIGAAFATVSADQVHFRLLLAGIDEAQIGVRGADRTLVVESRAPVTLRKILAAAERALRADYPGDTSVLTLVPHRGIEVPAIDLRAGEVVRYQAKAKTPLASSGRAAIDVTLSVNGKVREVVAAFFEMIPLELPVPSAAKERSAIRPASFSSPVLPARDFLIKSGDNVKLIAKVGSARLEALGEAQQNGRVGDVIRVRNVESSRVVHGRVEPSGMVLVEY